MNTEHCTPRFQIPTILLSLLVSVAGCERAARPDASNPTGGEIPSSFVRFVKEKRALTQKISDDHGLSVPNTVWKYFDSAQERNWMTSSNLYAHLEAASGRSGKRGSLPKHLWPPIHETGGAYGQFRSWSPQLLQKFADEIIKSIPPGSVYFGGTDAGRFVISAMSQSHTEGNPFFTLTQNALADQSYLQYLHFIYGQKLRIPDTKELGQVFQDYVEDARQRRERGALKEDEAVSVTGDGRVQVSGLGAVMLVNEGTVKLLMKLNPTREFFQEESYPLETLYPNAIPHGLILKMMPEPLERLPQLALDRDRDYWNGLAQWLVGTSDIESVSDLCSRTRLLYVKSDATGFKGIPAYLTDKAAPEYFSRCRSAIASIYQWRSRNASEQHEKAGLTAEADLAHRQAVMLAPFNPGVVLRYVGFLLEQKRTNDAQVLLKTSLEIKMPDWIDMATSPMTNALLRLQKTARELQVGSSENDSTK